MNYLKRILFNKVNNEDLRYRKFDFSFALKMAILIVAAGVFFDNPANTINFNILPLEEAIRVNLRPPLIMLGGIILGPIWGAFIGGVVDVIAFNIWHSDLSYLYIFTLTTIFRGFLAGYIYNYIFKSFSIKAVFISIAVPHFLTSGLMIPAVLNYYYNIPMLSNLRVRILVQIITLPIFTLAFYYMLRGFKKSKELRTLHQKLKVMLNKDELTGISNRKHFMEFLNKMFTMANRHSQPLVLLMADLDNFKEINDTYGHFKGDECLKRVANILTENIRNEDLAARMGGDEFVVLLPQTQIEEAKTIADRIKKSVQEIEINDSGSVTTSIGAAVIRKEDDIESFLKRADDALYKAKNNGRNRIEWMKPDNLNQQLKFS